MLLIYRFLSEQTHYSKEDEVVLSDLYNEFWKHMKGLSVYHADDATTCEGSVH